MDRGTWWTKVHGLLLDTTKWLNHHNKLWLGAIHIHLKKKLKTTFFALYRINSMWWKHLLLRISGGEGIGLGKQRGRGERKGALHSESQDLRSIIPSTFYTKGFSKEERRRGRYGRRGRGGPGGTTQETVRGRHWPQLTALPPLHHSSHEVLFPGGIIPCQ